MATKRTMEELLAEGAALLKGEGAAEVYVFGSFASGRAKEDSDVDLAISGLPPERFFPVMARLAALFRRPVDLVDLDEPGLFTRFLREEGLLQRVA